MTKFHELVPRNPEQNLRWRMAVNDLVRKDPSMAAVFIEACRQDPIFWLNGFCWTYDTRDLEMPKKPFILYKEFQDEAFMEIMKAIRGKKIGRSDILIEKSRDMGASWLCVAAITHYWRFHRNTLSFLFVSRVENFVDQTGNPKSLFWKFDYLIEQAPEWMRPVGYNKGKHRHLMHALNPENCSVIDGESTNKDVARGDRRAAILLDEFAAVKEDFKTLKATQDATFCRIFNSTHESTATAFYYMSQKPIKKLRLHWASHPGKNIGLYTTDEDGRLKVLDKEGYPDGYKPRLDGKLRSIVYDDFESSSGPRGMAQEWDNDPQGAGFQFFHRHRIEAAIASTCIPPMIVGELEYDPLSAEPKGFREIEEGKIRLWKPLTRDGKLNNEHRLAASSDVSAGTGASNSALMVYDIVTYEKVLEAVSPYLRPEYWAVFVVAVCRWLEFVIADRLFRPRLIWENNGPGRQFGAKVIELKYSNIYFKVDETTVVRKVTDIPGWAATREGKLVLFGEYRDALNKGHCINRSKLALLETLEYIFLPDGSIAHAKSTSKEDPSGAKAQHGDRVTADALGWKLVSESSNARLTRPGEQETPEAAYGTLAWRRNRAAKAELNYETELSRGW